DALGIKHMQVAGEDEGEDSTSSESEGEEEEEEGGEGGDGAEAKRVKKAEETRILHALLPKGFTARQILHAIRVLRKNAHSAAWGGEEETMEYLLLHLREEELPSHYDPRGRNLDVVLPTAKLQALSLTTEKRHPFGLEEEDWAALCLLLSGKKGGKEGERDQEGDDGGIIQALQKALLPSSLPPSPPPSSSSFPLSSNPALEEELENLRAIYGDTTVTIPSFPPSLPPSLLLSGALPPGHVLKVFLRPSLYPSLPAFALLEGPQANVRVQQELAACSQRMAGHAMLFELLLAATEALDNRE
ncbi:hypothetical protein VYU27_010460, partial [Nannochloropsis oceanica]